MAGILIAECYSFLCVPTLSRLVLSQNKKELLVNWWGEGKLEVCYERSIV